MTQLLQNALCGTALIFAAATLRAVLKDRLIPEIRLALWSACLLRLLTPVSPASVLSLWALPRRLAAPAPAQYAPVPSGFLAHIPVSGTAPSAAQAAPALSFGTVLLAIWAAVGAALVVRYILAWRRTRQAVCAAAPVPKEDPRYAQLPRCARLREGVMEGAPLTFGVVRPVVVLAPGLSGAALECVLAHEGTHARRRDNLWHYAMALVQVLFWWDPAVWLMARLLRRDIELACDRAALRRLGPDRRKEYALALVSIATKTPAKGPAFCHTFGRKAAEERIIAIMKFKKLSILGLTLSLLLVCGVTAAFATVPAQPVLQAIDPAESPDGRFFYKNEEGEWVKLDEDSVVISTTITVDEDGNITVSGELPDSVEGGLIWAGGFALEPPDGLTPVDPDSVDLSEMEQYLAKKVADGELTQEEADQMLADAAEMLEQARNGGVSMWMVMDGDGDFLATSTSTFGGEDISGDIAV